MIPISTDAPIYHYPIATVSMIVLNVILFFAVCREDATPELVGPDGAIYDELNLDRELLKYDSDEQIDAFLKTLQPTFTNTWKGALSLEFGSFLPWQWLTCNFMHEDIVHLIGNMVFLWSFGLVVEGKLGWRSFTAIYIGIGTIYGFILQMLSLSFGWTGIALGASAVIFGLLALCVAWVPANEFTVLWLTGWASTFDISISVFAGLYVLKEMFLWWASGFETGSAFLHLLGFFVAFPIGLWLVKSGYVDCEGWDLFSYLSGRTGRDSTIAVKVAKEKSNKEDNKVTRPSVERKLPAETSIQSLDFHSQVEQAIDRGSFDLAIRLQEKLSQNNPSLGWKQKDLYRVIDGLLKAKEYEKAAVQIEGYIERFHQKRFEMQLILIKIWLSQNRAKHALQYMMGMNKALMEPKELEQIKKLSDQANKLISAGATE